MVAQGGAGVIAPDEPALLQQGDDLCHEVRERVGQEGRGDDEPVGGSAVEDVGKLVGDVT